MLSLIIAHKVLLFYAQSGVGKTSLIKADLIPRLEEQGFEVFGPARVQGLIPTRNDLAEGQNIYILNTLRYLSDDSADLKQSSRPTFRGFLKREMTDGETELPPRVIIFDQFEELFTSYADCWKHRVGFFKQVAEALVADTLLRVVFVMREDYIAELDPHVSVLPESLQTRFRLERLREDAAISAVRGPLEEMGRNPTFSSAVATQLVKELLKIRVQTEQGDSIEKEGEFVEPVQLQVVCQRMWEIRWAKLRSDDSDVGVEHNISLADVDRTLVGFFEDRLRQVVQTRHVQEEDLRRWFQDKLITPAKTRSMVYGGKDETGSISNDAVKALEDTHLIRGEYRAGARWYELSHDRFIEPILESNSVWLGLAGSVRRLHKVAASWFIALMLFWLVVLEPALQLTETSILERVRIESELAKVEKALIKPVYLLKEYERIELGYQTSGLDIKDAMDKGDYQKLKAVFEEVKKERLNIIDNLKRDRRLDKLDLEKLRAAADGMKSVETQVSEGYLSLDINPIIAPLREKPRMQRNWLEQKKKLLMQRKQAFLIMSIDSVLIYASLPTVWSVLLLGLILYLANILARMPAIYATTPHLSKSNLNISKEKSDTSVDSQWSLIPLPRLKSERVKGAAIRDPLGWNLAPSRLTLLILVSLCTIFLIQFRVAWLGIEMAKQLGQSGPASLLCISIFLMVGAIVYYIVLWSSRTLRQRYVSEDT